MALTVLDLGAATLRAGQVLLSAGEPLYLPTTELPNIYLKQANGNRLFASAIPDRMRKLVKYQPTPIIKGRGLPCFSNGLPVIDQHGHNGTLHIPVVSDTQVDWQHSKIVLRELFQREHIMPDTPCMITESVLSPTLSTARMLEFLLEEISPSAISIISSPLAALCSVGKMSGFVLDSGEVKSQICTVLDGSVSTCTMRRSTLGGRHVTNSILTYMQEANEYHLQPALSYPVGLVVKHRFAFVAPQSEICQQLVNDTYAFLRPTHITLPDGARMVIEAERFRACECLVSTDKINPTDGHPDAFPNLVVSALEPLDTDTRAHILDDMYILGGTSNVRGLLTRMNRELPNCYYSRGPQLCSEAKRKKVAIQAVTAPDTAVFRGTALLGEMSVGDAYNVEDRKSASTWARVWRTPQECDEEGYARVVESLRQIQA